MDWLSVDDTRVVLRDMDASAANQIGSDYINANHIRVSCSIYEIFPSSTFLPS